MSNILTIIGLVSLGYGLWLVHPAAAFIGNGLIALVAAYGYYKLNAKEPGKKG